MMKQKSIMDFEKQTMPTKWIQWTGTERRPGGTLLYAFFFGAWLMVSLSMMASLLLFAHSWQWACLVLVSTLIFAFYLARVDSRLRSLRRKSFELKVDSENIQLSTFDMSSGKYTRQSLPWKEIGWAEIYRYLDEPVLILQSADSSIEIPLWAFGERKSDLMRTIESQNVPTLNIP